ncbi:hypothetical protein ACTXT7_001588, partial [Hymenolepis weldensis]
MFYLLHSPDLTSAVGHAAHWICGIRIKTVTSDLADVQLYQPYLRETVKSDLKCEKDFKVTLFPLAAFSRYNVAAFSLLAVEYDSFLSCSSLVRAVGKSTLPHLSTKNSIPEYKVQDLKSSCCILLHYSILKIVWDWLIVLCTFYFAIMVPYNAAFHRDGTERYLRTLDMIIEVLFIIGGFIDILLNFRTTFVSKSGQVVHHSKEIALNYIRGWFILDLIAAVPFDIIKTIQNPESPVATWMHLMKLARLLRLARLVQKIERYSQYSAVVLGILMCIFFLLAHWFACVWYSIGTNELRNLETRHH